MANKQNYTPEFKFKTPGMYRNKHGQLGHLSGKHKTGRYSFRTSQKRLEFDNEVELANYMKNNSWNQHKMDALSFKSILHGKTPDQQFLSQRSQDKI